MKRTIEEHAARFSAMAERYDETRGPAYRACADLVVEHAAPEPADVVLDIGTGTGAIALALAPEAGRVIGRDISEGMLATARETAAERGVDCAAFGEGRFRTPNVEGPVDVAVSNFAMHHLPDAEKREAIDVLAGLGPRRVVLGDVMLFDEANPSAPFYDPEVDDPATVGTLADALTDAGFALTAVERVTDQVGVLVAERAVPRRADAGPGAEPAPDPNPDAGPAPDPATGTDDGGGSGAEADRDAASEEGR